MKRKSKKQRIERDGKWYRLTPTGKIGVELTRAGGTMSEGEFFAFILSHCRNITIRWKPINDRLNANKRPYSGKDKRIKWEYQCEKCLNWFRKATKTIEGIEVDHIIPLGGINSFEKIKTWFEKALVEIDGLQCLCTACHRIKTNEERVRK